MRPRAPAIDGVSYAELDAQAREVAGALVERGVMRGERVAIAQPAGADFAAALHGCWMAGAVAVPIDLRLAGVEREVRTSEAALVIDLPLRGSPVEQPAPLIEDAGAVIVYTSGTTGAPRPVELTFRNWLANALGSAVALGLDPSERWLCPLPLGHVGGLSILIRSAIYATSALVPAGFDAELVRDALLDPSERITLVSLVPTMLARLLDAGLAEPPTLRWALLGGAPIAPALIDRAREARVPVAPTYGMSEACSQIATHGWPLAGIEVRLADDGEVLVAGPVVAPGALAPDGWLHTGDVGAFGEDGRLTITGRKAETIVSGGENVSPIEVEEVLLSHPAVVDAGVFGTADPEWGEAVAAVVVTAVSVSADDLRSFCRQRLAGFKVPKWIEFVDALPRNATGKLLRHALK
ncbi:MAG: AMP-binding protein [Solirubrobacterales bacterium]|nr:AMP-binding protein [Solirubrobacterales bacterium]